MDDLTVTFDEMSEKDKILFKYGNPKCQSILKSGPNKGKKCDYCTNNNDTFCSFHLKLLIKSKGQKFVDALQKELYDKYYEECKEKEKQHLEDAIKNAKESDPLQFCNDNGMYLYEIIEEIEFIENLLKKRKEKGLHPSKVDKNFNYFAKQSTYNKELKMFNCDIANKLENLRETILKENNLYTNNINYEYYWSDPDEYYCNDYKN